MQKTAIGANYDPNICPEFTKLGEFRNNTSHGNRKYGLRIFHALVPHTYPCKPSVYDKYHLTQDPPQTDPYWQNPKIPAIFEDSTFWKQGRNGAITERTGAVIFRNFKCADSGIACIEFSALEDIGMNELTKLENSLIVGNSGVNDDDGIISKSSVWGFIGPRMEYFTLDTVSFYNFDFSDSAAIGTCSHCFHPASTDSGGRTMTVRNLYIDEATVPRRIRY